MGKLICFLSALVFFAPIAHAADLTPQQVRAALETASPQPADLSGKDLSNLDLSKLDFKGANLSKANLFGANLSGSDLSKANLTGANLDAAWLMKANFTGANLTKASLFGPVIYPSLQITPGDRPNFKNANFTDARIIARFNQLDLQGANFSNARMGVDLKNQPMGQMRNDFSSANLSGVDFSGADINRALFAFADLKNANLSNANLFRADLTNADLTGANLTGANLAEADLNGAILKKVQGLDQVKGWEQARNTDKAVK